MQLPRLQQIPDPPKQLFAKGSLAGLEQPCLAVIGSRKMSPYGRQVTEQLVESVAAKGVTIVSGLALGIDSVAHKAALRVKGTTVAVMPAGLDLCYPASHTYLAKQIVSSGGALISECPAGTPAYKQHFIARNRLVSGLCQAVLIVEASLKSGTLHTVRFALEQGRDVLTVPGNITSESSAGTNNLIKSGAIPICGVSDLLEYFGFDERKLAIGSNREEQLILDLLQAGVNEATDLQLQSRLEAAKFNQTLTMLELSGQVKGLGGNRWSL